MRLPTLIKAPLALQALVFAMLTAAPARAEEPSAGITDDTVKIGISGPLTGPVAALGAIADGVRTRTDPINVAGGVRMADGKTRKIELLVEDDGLDPQRTLTNVRKLVEREEVLAVVATAGTPNNQAIGRYINQRGIPNLFMYSGVHELAGPEWEIGFVPSFTTEAATFAKYLLDNKRQAKVALLYLNTETGQTFQAALESAISDSGVTIVAAQPVTSADPTVETQLSTLKASGADTLVVITGPRQGAEAVRFATESGWKPTTLISNIAASIASLKPAGLENAKGVITSQFLKQVNASMPGDDVGVKRYLADHAAAQSKFSTEDALGQSGYAIGDALVKVLESMKAPTREAMMEAARNLDHAQLDLLLPGITLTTKTGEDVYPIESLQLFQFDGAAYQPMGDVISFEGKTPRH
ncbi:amino acid-binding protein [Phyllobacterium brassicacearum]|uniref:Amino acid-binding protein n=1 Tax=Phyllobacterium brassicacearum TaxID=314235 RepID=A0A2P7BUF7_9HYPH|nr:ABC transporter substrate-binding protein [Phyllobacterium brassicacearum]PSH70097.1 amino acid-binding protein [Phyllobacterium brassicacearum]TDQ34039.1 amino acid/amide ABC transporter substrate-binding protein (HAAT family) [Phyllobacterium brassicacearum]